MSRILWPPSRWSAVIWIGFLSLVLLARFPGNYLFYPPYLMDLEVYRLIAQRVLHGQAAELYQPTTSGLMLFKYAPCWALFWAPLGWFPSHQAAAIVWATLTVGWFALGCHGAHRLCEAADLHPPAWSAWIVVSLLVRSVTAEFLNGQVDLLWGLLTIAFLRAALAQRLWRAAFFLSLAISLKLPALIFLPYLAARRHYRLVAQTVLLFVFVNAAASWLLNPHDPLQLAADWLGVLRASGPARAFEIGNQSLFAFLGRFCSADQYHLNVFALPVTAVVTIAGGLLAVLCAAILLPRPAARLNESTRFVWDAALLSIVMVLGSPTVWIATYSVLLLPVTLLVASVMNLLREAKRDPLSWLCVLGLICLSAMTHSGFWRAVGLSVFRGESYVFLVFMILPWFGLVLFLALWRERYRLTARPQPAAAGISGS